MSPLFLHPATYHELEVLAERLGLDPPTHQRAIAEILLAYERSIEYAGGLEAIPGPTLVEPGISDGSPERLKHGIRPP